MTVSEESELNVPQQMDCVSSAIVLATDPSSPLQAVWNSSTTSEMFVEKLTLDNSVTTPIDVRQSDIGSGLSLIQPGQHDVESKTKYKNIKHGTNMSTICKGSKSNIINKLHLPVFLLVNMRSMLSKLDELYAVINDNNVDVVCITESWIKPSVPDDILQISGYTCYRRDRQDGRRGGGVVCYVREGLFCTHLDSFMSPEVESLWFLYRGNRMPRDLSHVVIGVVYHPPNSSSSVTVSHIVECLDDITRKCAAAGVVVLGDFNNMRDSGILSFPLRQIVKCPTRRTRVLDKIYTNIEKWYCQPRSLPPINKCDHTPVLLEPSSYLHSRRSELKNVVFTCRSSDQNGKVLLAHALQKFNWSTLYKMNNCEQMLNYFYSVCRGLLDQFLPIVTHNKHVTDKPWITDQFRNLVKRRQSAWYKNNLADYRYYRNKVQRAAKFLKQKYYERRIQRLRKTDPCKWWREVKKITGQSTRLPLEQMAENLCGGDIGQLCNDINMSLCSVSDDLQPLLPELIPSVQTCPAEYVIYPHEVELKLSRLEAFKAGGPDEIPNWFLRDFSVWLAEPISAIFNASLCEGVVPSDWKLANVVPIPKTRPPKDIASDLRPISLTPTLSKVLESFVGRWILDLIESGLDHKQYGCLRGKSTTHALVDLLHHWYAALDKGESIRAVFVDYVKAFDHVDHSTVVRKLVTFGIPDFLIRWICSFLTQRQQRVKLSQVFSNWITLKGAMPQGSWLGPLTFIVLIDDLSTSCLLHKFVDDTTLSEVISKQGNSNMLHYFSEVLSWSESNYMNVNFKKTKEMIVGTVRGFYPLLEVAGNVIERVCTFKLLGVTLDNKLTWDSHINNVCAKASTRIYFLKQLKRSGMSCEDLLHFYITIIRPVLEYACPAWHTLLTVEQTKRLESIQKRVLYIIYGKVDYYEFCERCGLLSLFERRDLLSRQFFQSIRDESSCLNYLLPRLPPNSRNVNLRNPRLFKIPTVRTNRFKNSFINYALEKYV